MPAEKYPHYDKSHPIPKDKPKKEEFSTFEKFRQDTAEAIQGLAEEINPPTFTRPAGPKVTKDIPAPRPRKI